MLGCSSDCWTLLQPREHVLLDLLIICCTENYPIGNNKDWLNWIGSRLRDGKPKALLNQPRDSRVFNQTLLNIVGSGVYFIHLFHMNRKTFSTSKDMLLLLTHELKTKLLPPPPTNPTSFIAASEVHFLATAIFWQHIFFQIILVYVSQASCFISISRKQKKLGFGKTKHNFRLKSRHLRYKVESNRPCSDHVLTLVAKGQKTTVECSEICDTSCDEQNTHLGLRFSVCLFMTLVLDLEFFSSSFFFNRFSKYVAQNMMMNLCVCAWCAILQQWLCRFSITTMAVEAGKAGWCSHSSLGRRCKCLK